MGFSTLIARVRERNRETRRERKRTIKVKTMERKKDDRKKEPKSDVLYESDSWQLLLLQRLPGDASVCVS